MFLSHRMFQYVMVGLFLVFSLKVEMKKVNKIFTEYFLRKKKYILLFFKPNHALTRCLSILESCSSIFGLCFTFNNFKKISHFIYFKKAGNQCCRGLKCLSLKTDTTCSLNNRELGCQCLNLESKGLRRMID